MLYAPPERGVKGVLILKKKIIVISVLTILVISLLIIYVNHQPKSNYSPSLNSSVPGHPVVPDRPIVSLPSQPEEKVYEKPVIYLYPPEPTKVSVNLSFDGIIDCTYPAYNEGWEVTAYPDGTLINHADGKEYSYLYWEGQGSADYDLSKGFVVKGEDTAGFLQEKLILMGLTPREYNEFIVYWLPQMQNNAYNLISFQGKVYTDSARLTIVPEPDAILRVFMVFKPLDKPVEIEEQVLYPFARKGFMVMEWGGAKCDKKCHYF